MMLRLGSKHLLLARRGGVARLLASSTSSSTSSSSGLGAFVGADQTIAQQSVYHRSHFVALGLIPLALVAHPSALSMPLDVALAVVLPVHAHIGMNWIFTDYVPGPPNGMPRMILLGVTVLATLGLLKMSVSGPGIVGTLKETWTHEEEAKKKSKKH